MEETDRGREAVKTSSVLPVLKETVCLQAGTLWPLIHMWPDMSEDVGWGCSGLGVLLNDSWTLN